jgi:predicted choloylglycine hydrolase
LKIQKAWALQLPWVEFVIDGYCLVNFVRCTVCSKVEGKKKLLIRKFDYLPKHSRRRKSIFVVMLSVKAREF